MAWYYIELYVPLPHVFNFIRVVILNLTNCISLVIFSRRYEIAFTCGDLLNLSVSIRFSAYVFDYFSFD